MLKIFDAILTCVLVVYREGGLYPKMPAFELLPELQRMQVREIILATEPISAPTPITASQPIPKPEEISAPEAIPAPDPIPEPVPIPGLEPIQAPEPIPESEDFSAPVPIPAPETLTASEVNGDLQPTQDSETFLVGNTEALKKNRICTALGISADKIIRTQGE
jgi:hypothetical protein